MDSIVSFAAQRPWTFILVTSVTTLVVTVAMSFLFGSRNHMPVDGKTILVTGASEGMGRSVAVQLSAKGANVIIVSRHPPKMEEALADIRAAAKHPASQRFRFIAADVGTPGYAAEVVAEATRWNDGRAPDVVWCVAGITHPMLWAEEEDPIGHSRRIMDVNYWGGAEMSRAILREWLVPENAAGAAAEPRHLVFTASVLALFAVMGYGTYNPSKWALRGLADTLAMELRMYPNNPVRVHLVCPGTITSDSFENKEQRVKPDVVKELEKDDPLQTPDEVARKAIAGLEAGHYIVTVGLLGDLMRLGILGGAPRNNWFFDTVFGWFSGIIYFIVLMVMHGQISSHVKKHGHPSTYAKKSMAG